jgi:glycosyltransferase involved in cell wall biosynthesis
MKILDIMPRIPFPPDDGGRIVLYNTYKYLSELGCEIDIFTFSNDNINEDIINKLKEYGNIKIVRKNTKNDFANILKYTLKNKPIYVYKYINNYVLSELERMYQNRQYDIIHCEHSATALAGLFLKQKYDVLLGHRMHNIEWKIWERYANEYKPNSLKKYFVKKQSNLLKKFEIDFYSKANINFSITDTDRDYALSNNPSANIMTSSIGVDPERWKINNNIERNENELIIATTYGWIHNINGLKWFIEKVLPIIQKEIPNIKLTMLGKNIPDYFKNHPNKAVNPVGYVDSVSYHLNRANLYIAPLFVGSGIRVKILEAMAMELPVIATKISAEGIKEEESITDNGLFVSDDPTFQAHKIIELIKNKKNRNDYGRKAREYVLQNFDWKTNIQIMLNKYKELLYEKEN